MQKHDSIYVVNLRLPLGDAPKAARQARYLVTSMTNNRLQIICALVDAATTIMLTVVFLSLWERKDISQFFNQHVELLILVLIITSLAAWRGYADAKRILARDLQWRRPAKEGFILGFMPLPVSQIIGISREAIAAGPNWPSPGYSPLSEWLVYIPWLLAWSAFLGVIGACYGLFLSWLNRLIVKSAKGD